MVTRFFFICPWVDVPTPGDPIHIHPSLHPPFAKPTPCADEFISFGFSKQNPTCLGMFPLMNVQARIACATILVQIASKLRRYSIIYSPRTWWSGDDYSTRSEIFAAPLGCHAQTRLNALCFLHPDDYRRRHISSSTAPLRLLLCESWTSAIRPQSHKRRAIIDHVNNARGAGVRLR